MKEKAILWLNKYKIKTQLFVTYLVAIVLPISIIGSILIINTRRLLSNYYNDLLAADNTRVKSVLAELSTQAFSISNEVVNNKDLRKLMEYQYYIPDNYDKDRKEVTVFEDVSSYPGIADISIYTDSLHSFESNHIRMADKSVKRSEWFRQATNSNLGFWSWFSLEEEDPAFRLVRSIPMTDKSHHAVMVMTVNKEYLSGKVQLSNENIQLILEDMSLIYDTSANQKLDPMSREELIQFQKTNAEKQIPSSARMVKIFGRMKMYGTSSSVYIISSDWNAYKKIRLITFTEMLCVVIAAALSFLLVHFFNTYFTRRIDDLRNAMHHASNDEYDLSTFHISGDDEVSEAYGDLLVMIDKIKEKDAQMYETQLRQRSLAQKQQEMEFEMLASKINPHFLYNTLESIRMKAFTAGDREVASAIKLLGKSMRYVLENTGTQFTSLDRELDHIRTYLAIQKLRFENRFDSRIVVGEGIDTKDIQVLPLLLQPIVENALLHGLEEVEEGGMIEVLVEEREEKYQITIADNGSGMDGDTLNRLLENINTRDDGKRKSIGLYNINQRLKLTYGEEYGLMIQSAMGRGTTVVVNVKK